MITRKTKRSSKLLHGLIAVLAPLIFLQSAAAGTLSVFAAASLQGPLDAVAEAFEAKTGETVTLTYASTATLARQIAIGAPADIFMSANQDWAQWLLANDRGTAEDTVDLLSNRLVLIATAPITVTQEDLASSLATGQIAMAFSEAVPAGIYAREALQSFGLWEDVAARVVESDTARTALAHVALGAVPLGLVYQSDAAAEPAVHAVFTFPADSHSAIAYPAMQLTARPEVEAFFEFLQSGPALEAFYQAGFDPLSLAQDQS